MHEMIKETFVPYLSQLGLKKACAYNNVAGVTFTPDKDLGKGYFWTYPVKNLFCITVFDLFFYEDVSYRYKPVPLLNVSKCSKIVAAPIVPQQKLRVQNIIGYRLNGQQVHYSVPKNTSVRSISISIQPEYFSKYLPSLYHLDFSRVPDEITSLDGESENKSISTLFDSLLQFSPHSPMSDLFYESKLLELSSILLENCTTPNYIAANVSKKDLEYINALVSYIKEHLADDIDLKLLSSISCMGKTKLYNLFKETYGMAIHEYIQTLRLDTAKNYLADSQYSIKEISNLVGYHRQSSFSEFFKKKTGCTPAEFRNLYLH